MGDTFRLNIKQSEYIGSEEFKVLSYNVRLFDKYNWVAGSNTTDKIIDFIEDENADVICLQEVPGGRISGETYKGLLKNVIKGKRTYFASHDKNNSHKTGVLTISKYPILKKGVIRFDNSNNVAIWTDIKVNYDTIRVFNLHLQSIRLNPSSYKMLDTLDLNQGERNLKEAGDIAWHLKDAFKLRSKQAKIVSKEINKANKKVIVCGDFNDQPVSYTYHKISSGLIDSFEESGRGISNTYIGKFPSFRIDYILHDESFHSREYNVTQVELSDHYPVSCKIIIP